MTTPERVPNSTPVESQINQLQPRPEKSPYQPQSVKGWWNRFFAALLLSSQLSACISAESRFVVPTDTEPRVVATSVLPPQKSPESAAPTVPQPSPTATKEASAPTPTYVVEASGGAYTPAQEALNQSPEALAQQQRLQRWLDYWVKFDNRPFALDSADIHWKYIYDNAKNPKEVMTLLEVSGPDYQNKLFTVPMNEEGFVDYPPTVTGKYIQPGLGPLEINPHKDNTILSVDQGTLVRLDSQGKIVERLSQAHWEAVERYPIDMEKLSHPPQSYEDFVNNLDKFVQAPSPDGSDENFQEFVTWYNETLFQKTLGGDLEALPVNYDVEVIGISVDMLSAYNRNSQERHSLPYFFYFKDRKGVPYPCYIVTLATPEYQQTLTIVRSVFFSREWAPLLGSPDMITEVYQGINSFSYLNFSFTQSEYYSDIENDLIDQGFGTYPSTIGDIPIGFGSLSFMNK